MIDLFDLWQQLASQLNISQNGWWRPESDFEVQANLASIKLWNDKIDLAERDQRIVDDLRNFFKSKNIIVKNQNSFYGTIDLSDKSLIDYGRFASARLLLAGQTCVPCKDVDEGLCCNGTFKTDAELADDYYNTVCETQIEKIDNQRWPSVLQHLTKRPTLLNPKLTQINNQFQVAPRQVTVVRLNYYVKPKYATFKYTLSQPNLQNGSGDVIIYNKAASQPLEWPETVKNELLDILKDKYIGFTRDGLFQQINQSQKQTA
jgi:hypothetical protein